MADSPPRLVLRDRLRPVHQRKPRLHRPVMVTRRSGLLPAALVRPQHLAAHHRRLASATPSGPGIGAAGVALLGPLFFDESHTTAKAPGTVMIASVIWLKLADRPNEPTDFRMVSGHISPTANRIADVVSVRPGPRVALGAYRDVDETLPQHDMRVQAPQLDLPQPPGSSPPQPTGTIVRRQPRFCIASRRHVLMIHPASWRSL